MGIVIPFPNQKYSYRNLPCNIMPDEHLWCVVGHDKQHNSWGVLEWCYNERDANRILDHMKRESGRFVDLKAEPYSATVAKNILDDILG